MTEATAYLTTFSTASGYDSLARTCCHCDRFYDFWHCNKENAKPCPLERWAHDVHVGRVENLPNATFSIDGKGEVTCALLRPLNDDVRRELPFLCPACGRFYPHHYPHCFCDGLDDGTRQARLTEYEKGDD